MSADGVGLKWNRDQGIEQFLGRMEVRVHACQIEKPKLGTIAERVEDKLRR